jgi:GDPmannose 4,6-dehydratase
VGKLAGHALVNSYREQHGLYATSGILYNHESPRRPVDFVTRKIVNAAVAIKLGHSDELVLGDTSAQRDWGFAPDYVEAIWLMLQQDTPRDFVIATGKLHTVQDLVDTSFSLLGLEVADHVRRDPALMRKGDEAILQGNPASAKEHLGWEPRTQFSDMLQQMIDHELATVSA